MRQFTKLLLLLVLLCSLPAESIAQRQGRKTPRPSPPRTICKIESVPNGMVVVGYKRNSACSDGSELTVKWPENGDIICAESSLPPQFSVAAKAQGDSARACPNGAFLIVGRGSSSANVGDDSIDRAFAAKASDIQVEGEGTVIRVLSDDVNGSRHQRFIVELASGQTLLIAHNIDIAPRIDRLEAGDSVRFYGEYVWNAKGGVIHWTHRDPLGKHVSGWIVHNAKTYK